MADDGDRHDRPASDGPGRLLPGHRGLQRGPPGRAHNLSSIHWQDQRISGASRKMNGRLIGISGQVASDRQQNIIARGDVASQAHYCFGQIRGVLEMH